LLKLAQTEYPKRIAPIFLSVFFMRFSFGLTVLTLQTPTYGLDTIERGVIGASFPAAEITTAFVFGILADRYRRKLIITYALAGSSASNLAFVVTRNVDYLAIAHGAQGLCSAAVLSSSLALLTHQAYSKTRGREMGVYDFSILSGYFAGFVFSGIITSVFPSDLSLPFYGGAVLALFGSVFAFLFIRETEHPKGRSIHVFDNLRYTLSNRRVWGVLPTWTALTMFIGVVLTFTREFGFFLNPKGSGAIFANTSSDGYFAMELALGSAGLAFTQPYFGKLSDTIGRRKLVFVGEVSVLGVFLSLITIRSLGLPLFLGLGLIAPFGIGMLAFTPAALASLADNSKETNVGSTMGLYTLSVGVGTITGQLLGGELLYKFGVIKGFIYFFEMGSAILVLAILVTFIFDIAKILKSRRMKRITAFVLH
jgi:MFS family permease